MKTSNLVSIILAISLRYSHARAAEKDTRLSPKASATPEFTTISPILVDPEALNVAATKPMLDGELLTSTELFEGDILGIDPEFITPAANNRTDSGNDNYYGVPTWPENLVPYVLSNIFRPKDKQAIRDALQDFTAKTMVKFRERQGSDDDYVYIAPGFGCSSYVGRIGDKQLLVLQVPGCLTRGYIHHLLMHTLGFVHEQSRINRDENVQINWDNIPKAQHSSFQKQDIAYSLNDVRPYDIASLMHYGMFDFAIDKRVCTIRPQPEKNNTAEAPQMGQRQGLSAVDVEKIKLTYPNGKIYPGTTCPKSKGWAKHRNNCYFFSFLTDTQPRNFSSAITFCQAKDAKISSEPIYETAGAFFAAQMHSSPLDSDAKIYVGSCNTISPLNVSDTKEGSCDAELHFICAKPLILHSSRLVVRYP